MDAGGEEEEEEALADEASVEEAMEEGGAGIDGADSDDHRTERALGRLTSAEMLPGAAAFQPPPAVRRASEDGRLPQPSAEMARRLSEGMRLIKEDAEEETGRARRLSNP